LNKGFEFKRAGHFGGTGGGAEGMGPLQPARYHSSHALNCLKEGSAHFRGGDGGDDGGGHLRGGHRFFLTGGVGVGSGMISCRGLGTSPGGIEGGHKNPVTPVPSENAVPSNGSDWSSPDGSR
jgi:hypothetical protein